jgi:hypothetical protein
LEDAIVHEILIPVILFDLDLGGGSLQVVGKGSFLCVAGRRGVNFCLSPINRQLQDARVDPRSQANSLDESR